ncbi:MAG: SulP family inorganic anion transporter [Cytophagaceae bacterium]
MEKDVSLFENLKKTFRKDIISGFLVFLIALPLCLGIAMASGFPPIAGILTAIIGGLLVTFIGGSEMTIKGPAAGLIVIALGSVEALGNGDMLLGYRLTLAVIVVAGILQVIFGILRSGVLGDFFPSSTVHGMLAAIGIIIAGKQIHTALGVIPQGKQPLEQIFEIPNSILNLNPYIATIGILSLAILFILPQLKNKYIKMIPAPMLVILLAIPLGHLFGLSTDHTYLFMDGVYKTGPEFLVTLPSNILDGFTLPDFSMILTSDSIKYIIMFAIVGSLETVISTKAVDLLDPEKKKSDLNKDLIGVGIGNTICGFIGALPMISEIVRSSANINNGAKSRWSNFYHGMFLLIFVAFAPMLLQQIPLAALAAMLIYTGYRLASPKVFKETFRVGPEQLLIFVITIIVTLATDLLVGIFAGVLIELVLHVGSGAPLKSIFKSTIVTKESDGTKYKIKIKGSAIFSNYIHFKKQLEKIPSGKKVVLDFSGSKVVDHTVMEHLYYFGEEYTRNGGSFLISGLENKKAMSQHPLSSRVKDNNSYFSQNKSRKSELKKTALDLNLKFIPMINNPNGWYGSLNEGNSKVILEGNIIYGKINEAFVKISDIAVNHSGNLKTGVISLTALHGQISGEETSPLILIPKIKEGYDDFSSTYKFKHIREVDPEIYFPSDVKQFLSKNNKWNLQFKGNEIMMYIPYKILQPEEIIELLTFFAEFINLMENSKKELPIH